MDDKQATSPLRSPQFLISIAFFVLVIIAVAKVMWAPADGWHDLQIVVVTAVVVRGTEALLKYWLSSSNDSEKKNDTINTLAKGTGSGTLPPASS